MMSRSWEMGYSDEDIRKFYGGNKLRVYKQVCK
jgi:microsomal dipeptidase-like Zn-dependent dipeptidase